jgi:hypothetical protein
VIGAGKHDRGQQASVRTTVVEIQRIAGSGYHGNVAEVVDGGVVAG